MTQLSKLQNLGVSDATIEKWGEKIGASLPNPIIPAWSSFSALIRE